MASSPTLVIPGQPLSLATVVMGEQGKHLFLTYTTTGRLWEGWRSALVCYPGEVHAGEGWDHLSLVQVRGALP